MSRPYSRQRGSADGPLSAPWDGGRGFAPPPASRLSSVCWRLQQQRALAARWGPASSPCSRPMTAWLEDGQLRVWGPCSAIHLVCGVPRETQGCGGAVALRAMQFRCEGSDVAGCHKLKFTRGNATQGNSPQGEKVPAVGASAGSSRLRPRQGCSATETRGGQPTSPRRD